MTRDYYDLLGVEREADAETIKRAYRTRARALHPDVSGDAAAAEGFRELSEAYAVLSKQSTRLLYDRFGYRGRGNGWFSPDGAAVASDFVRRSPPVAEVLVDELEAKRGIRRQVRWRRAETCEGCDGGGGAPGALTMPCPECAGAGHSRVESSLADGERLLQLVECATCSGRGRLVSEPCPICDGAGETVADEAVEVVVPPGASDGDRVPLEGAPGRAVVVRVLASAPEHTFLRYAAAVGLLVALVFLWLLLR